MKIDLPTTIDLFHPEKFRSDAHRIVDILADWLHRLATDDAPPVLPRGTVNDVCRRHPSSFPRDGASLDGLLADVLDDVTAVSSPRFMGHQVAPVLPLAAALDMVSALTNNGMAVFEMGKAATAMERAVLQFFAARAGFSEDAGGVLTSGGSIGNLTALLAARQAKSGANVWQAGTTRPLAVAVSEAAHYSVARAIRLMGLGDAGILTVAVDEKHQMRPEALADVLSHASTKGTRVFAVVAQAGSTGVGAFDPIADIVAVAKRHDAWVHVDGAHGGALLLSDRRREMLSATKDVDSIVIDAHKMLMMPALVTAVLMKSASAGAAAFAQEAAYLFHDDEHEQNADVGRRTIECTKRMMALKLYVPLALYGPALFADHVDRCCDLATAMAREIDARGELELLVEPPCNIVCFRARGKDGGVQAAIRRAVVEDGRFYIVHMRLENELWLRTVLLHPSTTMEDICAMLDLVTSLAQKSDTAKI